MRKPLATPKPRPVLLMVRELGLGGTERQLCEMAKTLDHTRFQVHVGCFHAEGMRADELKTAGVPTLRLPVRSLYAPSTALAAVQLRRYLKQNSIQLVHTFDVPMNLFGVPASRLFRVPVVISSQRAYRNLTPGLTTRLLRVSDRMADAIVVNCDAMKRHLMEDEKVPGHLIEICYNGLDTGEFHARRPAPPDDSITIGVICALRPEKGLRTLIEAFACIGRPPGQVRLLIAGSGPMLPELETLSRTLGIENSVTFEPATSRVAERLRTIDIFVLPSLSEALSNSLMEAMACECAVVASRVGGNVELVQQNETGLLFEPGDAGGLAGCLQNLVDDEQLRRRLARAGSGAIRERYSLQRAANRLGEIYEKLLT